MAILAIFLLAALPLGAQWKRHLVAEGYANQTAIAADFTGDGLPDIVSNDYNRTILYVAPDWKPVVIHEGLHAIHSAVMDVDGDGDPDLVIARYTPGRILWLECPARPLEEKWAVRLVDDSMIGGVNGVHGLMAGDIDGDGRLDLAATSGQPDGKFPNSVGWFKVPPEPKAALQWERHIAADKDAPGLNHYVGIGDIDGDGKADLATGAKFPPDGNYFAWWKQPKDASRPWEKHVVATIQEGATNILMARINSDPRMDFVASRGHGFGVVWFEAPEWKEHAIDPKIGGPHSLGVGDIDGDGDLDVAACGKNSRFVAWYENDGEGGFIRRTVWEGQSAYDLRLVDMDRDGDLDILLAGEQSNNVVWFENPSKK